MRLSANTPLNKSRKKLCRGNSWLHLMHGRCAGVCPSVSVHVWRLISHQSPFLRHLFSLIESNIWKGFAAENAPRLGALTNNANPMRHFRDRSLLQMVRPWSLSTSLASRILAFGINIRLAFAANLAFSGLVHRYVLRFTAPHKWQNG